MVAARTVAARTKTWVDLEHKLSRHTDRLDEEGECGEEPRVTPRCLNAVVG